MKLASGRLLKVVLYGLGSLAALGFLITKNATTLAWATWGDYRYGDLHRFAQIMRFRPAQPLATGTAGNDDSIDQGNRRPKADELIFLGDSFGFSGGESPFHAQLGQQLGVRMFTVNANHHEDYWRNPYLLLQSSTNQTFSQRILVFEVVERLIPQLFSNSVPFEAVAAPDVPPASFFGSIRSFKDRVFENTEHRHENLIKHGILTRPVVCLWNSAVFEFLHILPDEITLYSQEPPFLFFRDEVTCFQSDHGDPLVARLADHIALLDENLRRRFNCVLVFIPIPNKLTVYSRLATKQSYDEFLPRLCVALKKRGVRTVELLPRFRQEQDLLYWPTDTHWNNLGIRIAVQETLKTWPPAETSQKPGGSQGCAKLRVRLKQL